MEQKYILLDISFAEYAQNDKISLIKALVGQFPDNFNLKLAHGTTISL
ncbi:MAG: hypothetical protein ACFFAN_00655 [Promethearchaeota archaeon]